MFRDKSLIELLIVELTDMSNISCHLKTLNTYLLYKSPVRKVKLGKTQRALILSRRTALIHTKKTFFPNVAVLQESNHNHFFHSSGI